MLYVSDQGLTDKEKEQEIGADDIAITGRWEDARVQCQLKFIDRA